MLRNLYPIALAVPLAACSSDEGPRVISHTETDKHGMMGGVKHDSDTVYQNPDGTVSR